MRNGVDHFKKAANNPDDARGTDFDVTIIKLNGHFLVPIPSSRHEKPRHYDRFGTTSLHSKAKTKKFCKIFFQIGNLIFFSGLNVGGGMVPNGPPAFDKFAPRPRLKYGTHRV